MVKTQLILIASLAAAASAFSPMQTPSTVSFELRTESYLSDHRKCSPPIQQCSHTHRLFPYTSLFQNSATAARRDFLKAAGVAAVLTTLPNMASAETIVPVQSTDYSFPTDWGLSFKYEEDAAKVREHMLLATGMAKGSEKMEDFGKNMKKEMVDFVSYYRRFPKIAGKPSFSTLYTSINVLAGHYTSYGFKYPLPEKRRKRLYQEYTEIDKSLKRGR
jgi:photosystem II Psb27 protein